jgi:hypothetical protein
LPVEQYLQHSALTSIVSSNYTPLDIMASQFV